MRVYLNSEVRNVLYNNGYNFSLMASCFDRFEEYSAPGKSLTFCCTLSQLS